MKPLTPLEVLLDPIRFEQYMRQPRAVIENVPFDVWKERCRPVPTNPATGEHGDE